MSLPIWARIVGGLCLPVGCLALLIATAVLLSVSTGGPSPPRATVLSAMALIPAGVASLFGGVWLFFGKRERWDSARSALWVAAVAFVAASLVRVYGLQEQYRDLHWAEETDRNQKRPRKQLGLPPLEVARVVRGEIERTKIELVVTLVWVAVLIGTATQLARFTEGRPVPSQDDVSGNAHAITHAVPHEGLTTRGKDSPQEATG